MKHTHFGYYTRGYSFLPLHKNAPQAALEDVRLYQLLALVDALRDGRVRERRIAVEELGNRLEHAPYTKPEPHSFGESNGVPDWVPAKRELSETQWQLFDSKSLSALKPA